LKVGRGIVLEPLGEGRFRGLAIPLEQHVAAVKLIVERVFAPKSLPADVLTVASELHDKYKPARMRVEKCGDRFEVGFRGHPYLLSFSDFEEVLGIDREPRKIAAVATGIARLHHFLNIRDVDTFVHTLALVKAYLTQSGIHMPLRDIRVQVLEGVVLLHVADMIAGYIEQVLLAMTRGHVGDISVVDTDSLEHVEPHIPVAMRVVPEGGALNAWVYLHGLEHVVENSVLSGVVELAPLRYDVYEGIFEEHGFDGKLKQGYDTTLYFTHKRALVHQVVTHAPQQYRH